MNEKERNIEKLKERFSTRKEGKLLGNYQKVVRETSWQQETCKDRKQICRGCKCSLHAIQDVHLVRNNGHNFQGGYQTRCLIMNEREREKY